MPSFAPAGILTLTCLFLRTLPLPPHTVHGFSMILPSPQHLEQGVESAKNPWSRLCTPLPPHCGHVSGAVRGRPRAPALAARLLDRHTNPRRYTFQGIVETQPDIYGYILTFCTGRPSRTGRTSEDIPQVPEAAEQIRDVSEVRATWLTGALGAEECAGALVVFPSFLGFR